MRLTRASVANAGVRDFHALSAPRLDESWLDESWLDEKMTGGRVLMAGSPEPR